MVIPGRANCCRIGGSQITESPNKQRFFRRHQPIEPGNRRLGETCRPPIRNPDIERSGWCCRCDSANQHVEPQIKQDQRRSLLAQDAGSKREAAKENFAEQEYQ